MARTRLRWRRGAVFVSAPALIILVTWTVTQAAAGWLSDMPWRVAAQIQTASAEADLALVLAVDVSGSMSRDELGVQRHGYVAAFRHADVVAAIAFHAAIAVAYVEWAGPNDQSVIVPWTVLRGAEDAARFADRLGDAPLKPAFGSPPWKTGTSISNALLFAADLFADAPAWATRVIDISGNGFNNSGGPLDAARASVLGRGITVNGLPIVVPRPYRPAVAIDAYYEDCVIGGPGAFALAVTDAADLEGSIRRKIVLEIAGQPPAITPAAQRTAARIDCARAGAPSPRG